MLILPNSCFLHIPKTGGTWVTRAIEKSGIPTYDIRIDGDPHIGLGHVLCRDRFRFAFIRHPLGLYRSYWQFKMTYGWDERNPLDQSCHSDHFHTFVEQVLDRFPGFITTSLVGFLGEDYEQVDFIGKYENLVDDLIKALRMAGEVFDEAGIRALAPCNVSNKEKYPAEFTPGLEQRIRESEQRILDKFGYA